MCEELLVYVHSNVELLAFGSSKAVNNVRVRALATSEIQFLNDCVRNCGGAPDGLEIEPIDWLVGSIQLLLAAYCDCDILLTCRVAARAVQ